jgi:hypothetical protein
MKVIYIILLAMLLSLPVFAANDVYIAQSAAGSNNGTSCANAKALTYFNTSGNWSATPTGIQIGPGTIVHACGTFSVSSNTNVFTFQGSGTSGNVVELRWEPGATLTSPTWGTLGNAAVNTSGNQFILINGNCQNYDSNGFPIGCATPSITATGNGSGLATQQDGTAITSNGSMNNIEIENMTITNMYQHSSVSDTACGCGSGIFSNNGGSHIKIHDVFVDQAFIAGFDDAYQNGDQDIQIYKNTFDHFNWGIHIGNNSTATLTNVLVHNNHLKNMSNWDTTTDSFHHDGLFVVQNNTSANITNVQFYNNLADGAMSVPANCGGNTCATAWIFYNTGMHGIYVYNNVLIGDGSSFLLEGGFTGDTDFEFYNNYLKCGSTAQGGGIAMNYSNVSTWKFENNAVDNCSTGSTPFTFTNITSQTADYNDYKGWTSGETHSLNSANLSVSSLGVPTAGSPLLHNLSTQWLNLTSTCSTISGLCSDFNGVARPNTAFAWDAGAYQGATTQANSPTFSPVAGTYSSVQSITITDSNTGTHVTCYTVNGTTPATNGLGTGCSTGTQYTTPISIGVTETLNAISGTSTLTDSSITSGLYTINLVTQAVAATCSPTTGTSSSSLTVTCTNTNTGTTIMCYTLNGTTPVTNNSGTGCTTGTLLSGSSNTISIVVSVATLKIIAGTSNKTDSAVNTYGQYFINPGGFGTPCGACMVSKLDRHQAYGNKKLPGVRSSSLLTLSSFIF